MDNRKNSKDLNIANKEITLLNDEKEIRIAELNQAYKEISFQIEEKGMRAAERAIANIELEFQNHEKENRAAELIVANKELVFQSREKEKRAAELLVANKELAFQSQEKEKRAAELLIANKELVFQNNEKEKRAAELLIANKELIFQNNEKEKRAAELSRANQKLKKAEAAVRNLNAKLERKVVDLHANNITGIKRSERQIKEIEAFTLGILNSLNYHIAVINESGEIVAVNEAWKQFALQNGETTLQRTGVGSNYFKVCEKSAKNGDEIAKETLKGLMDVMNKRKTSLYLEYPCDSPNLQRWFAMRAIKLESEKPMIVIVHMDILERKLAEENLVRRNRDLEQFTFIISHNLRAPAANIIVLSELLMDETLPSPIQKELIQALSTSALGLDSVIKDINFILQVKHEVDEKKELISFSQLVEEIITSNNNLIHSRQVRIESNFSEVDEIISLKVYLHSIFYNLISNSIKYSMPDAQPIIQIQSRRENGKIIISFRDNGLGFDMKKTGDKIFGLYKRFHPKIEGKGMGLFMVKTQVEAIGGRITVASEVNKGTEFTVILEG